MENFVTNRLSESIVSCALCVQTVLSLLSRRLRLQGKCSSRTKCLGCWSLRAEHERSPAAEFLLTERRPNEKSRSLQQLGKCYLLSGVDGIIHTLAGNSLSSKAEYDTTVGSALKRVYRTMRTRPRRSHHRLGVCRCRKTPPTIAAALQSSPGRVWTPVLVRDRPWLHDSASRTRLHSFSSTLGFGCFSFFWAFLWSSPGFPGVCLCACCVWVLVCVCVRAWARLWCSLPGPSWPFSAFLRCLCCCGGPFGAWPLVFVSLGSCPGRFSGPVFPGFSPGSRKTHGGRTSPRLVRSSLGSPQS